MSRGHYKIRYTLTLFVSLVSASFLLAVSATAGETVELGSGVTFENPDGWILATQEQERAVAAAGAVASAGLLGSAAPTAADAQRYPKILAITSKYPIGTQGNFVITFSKIDFSHVDLGDLERMPTSTELLDVVTMISQEQIQKVPGLLMITDEPIAEVYPSREWRVLKYKIAPAGYGITVVTHAYMTMLGERSALSITAQARPDVFELHQGILQAVIKSLKANPQAVTPE